MLSSSSVPSPLNFPRDRYPAPLDVLLGLIHEQQFDIHDIPIPTITRQYLEYLEEARRLGAGAGAEFFYLAATLIHIKSETLSRRIPSPQKQGQDPRRELVERLLHHRRFHKADGPA